MRSSGAYLVWAAFAIATLIRIVLEFVPVIARRAAHTDFRGYQSAIGLYRQGISPYDMAAQDQYFHKHLAVGMDQQHMGRLNAPFLYPPFAVYFFDAWLGPDILANAKVWEVVLALCQIVTVGLAFALCGRLGLGGEATAVATAVLAIFYLQGQPAQDAMTLGQMSIPVGLLLVAAVYGWLRGWWQVAYGVLALGGSLKVLPLVLLALMPPKKLIWLLLPLAVLATLNLPDPWLVRAYLTADLSQYRTYIQDDCLAHIANHSLPSVSYKTWHLAWPGYLVGYGLLLLVGVWIVFRFIAQRGITRFASWPYLQASSDKGAVLPEAVLLLLTVSLASPIFWEQHMTMFAPLVVVAEAWVLSRRGNGGKLLWSDWLGILSVALVLFSPRFTFGGVAGVLNFPIHQALTVGALGLVVRYGWEVWGAAPSRTKAALWPGGNIQEMRTKI